MLTIMSQVFIVCWCKVYPKRVVARSLWLCARFICGAARKQSDHLLVMVLINRVVQKL